MTEREREAERERDGERERNKVCMTLALIHYHARSLESNEPVVKKNKKITFAKSNCRCCQKKK